MKLTLQNLQIALVYIFILFLPLQVNHTFFTASPQIGGQNVGYLHISLYLSDLLLLVLLACSMLNKQNIFKIDTTYGIKRLILGIFVLQGLIFAFLPRETIFSSYFMLKMVENIAILLMFAKISRESLQIRLFQAFAISGLVQAVVAIGQFMLQKSLGLSFLWESPIGKNVAGVSKTDFHGETIIRSYGLFFHPNQLAIFLVVACATTLHLLLTSKERKPRIFYGLTYILIIAGLFMTFSRAGLLALGTSTLVISALYILKVIQNQNHYSYIRKVIGGVWLTIILASAISLPMLMARTSLSDKSVTERIDFNQNGIELIKERPVLGHGIGRLLPAIYNDRPNLQAWEMQPPHNYFIVVACETGLLGMLMIVLLFAYYLKKLYQHISERGPLASYATIYLSIFIGFLITMFFDHYFYHLQQTQLLLWLLLGLGAGLRIGEKVK